MGQILGCDSNLPIIENRVHNDMLPKQPCKEEVIERILGLSRYQIMDHYQYEFFTCYSWKLEMSMMKSSIAKLTCLEESDMSSTIVDQVHVWSVF